MSDIDVFLKQLKSTKPEAIVLFGSYAEGKATEDSDIDVLVIKKTTQPFRQRSRSIHMKLKTTIPADIIVLTPKESHELPKKSSFFRQILQNGKLIYGRIPVMV